MICVLAPASPLAHMARLGVCSWSLRPRSPRDLLLRVRATGLDAVQLALDPLRRGAWPVGATAATLAEGGVAIRSGMMGMEGEDYSTLESIRATGGVRPDATWERNLAAAAETARLARDLGLELVSFHAGFLPEAPDDPERAKLLERLAALADLFAAEAVDLALESGQESAATLRDVLRELDRPEVGVNLDPANMLLYDRDDPVRALSELAPWVRQIHVKDARRTRTPGRWGEEVPAGRGEVDWTAFFDRLAELGLVCDLMIERESGHDRVGDVRAAATLVRGQLARTRGTRAAGG